jgi:hypothetical protein
LNWLQEWYRTPDQLLAHKDRIEVELFGRLRAFQVDFLTTEGNATLWVPRSSAAGAAWPGQGGYFFLAEFLWDCRIFVDEFVHIGEFYFYCV